MHTFISACKHVCMEDTQNNYLMRLKGVSQQQNNMHNNNNIYKLMNVYMYIYL